MKLIWLSDPHLEFPTDKVVRKFIAKVGNEKPDAIIITGDISNALRIEYHLGLLATLLCPIYFVLGNHDFYEGGFAPVDATVKEMCRRHPNLIHLGSGEIVRLTDETTLIGHRGWADGRAGLGEKTTTRLNDHLLIQNLARTDSAELFAILNALGDQSAEYIRTTALEALSTCQRLIVATHVPPFLEASLYQGKPSEPAFAPHFVNVAMGKAILDLAHLNPEKEITVLCGHTHHLARYSPLPNLTVRVAGAEYNRPMIADVINL
jgi:predicted MPP superfamily phosphohydrolase